MELVTLSDSFDFKIITTLEELKNMKVAFTVWHKRSWYQRDMIIGSYSLDIWTVYSKATKMVNRDWEPLEDNESNKRGFIQYSVTCVGEGDTIMGIIKY